MKSTKLISILLVFVALLSACSLTTEAAGNTPPTISLTDVNSTAESAASTLFAQTVEAIPSSTFIPTETRLAATPTPLPFMALDGLRVVYTDAKGNLYVQDSGKPSIQLAHDVKESTENHPLLISDDGQKVIFYRAGEANLDAVYVINADGTGEQVLVNPELLSSFGNVYNKSTTLFSPAFVPGTHLLLFNTYQQGNLNPEAAAWLPIVGNDLFVVNTDTGKIKQLKAPLQGGNFLASPNGKWVAVQTLDHIDIIDIQGQIIRRNLVTYDKSESNVVVPMYWTTDSRELITLPSGIPLFAGVPVVRTVWRYPLDSSSGIEINLTPSPAYDWYAVSPDGNWVAYSYDMGNLDPHTTSGVYLGNLNDGTSQLLYAPQSDTGTGYLDVPKSFNGWSTDSTHIIFTDEHYRIYMGNIHGEVVTIGTGIGILGWIDNNRYLLYGSVGEVGKQARYRVVELPADLVIDTPKPIAFVFLEH